MSILRLTRAAAAQAANVRTELRHPGLQLDRLSVPARQEDQRPLLDAVVQAAGDPGLLRRLIDRRTKTLAALKAAVWNVRTQGALTLHLSRRGALENVGLALHPLYGFAYLPGSGLKGLTRAWATTFWLKDQKNESEAWERIKQVFGWQPDSNASDHSDTASDSRRATAKEDGERAGAVVFHDAWPVQWPKLIIDTATTHHSDYYGAADHDIAPPPGDWENPVPISFLAVAADQEFSCALSSKKRDADRELVDQAREWLTESLVWLGAGAKTNAGYGTLIPVAGARPSVKPSAVEVHESELKLVTPGFFAGAEQSREDCDLRPATLRGLLRQWWRTRHAGFVDVATLRRLEAAVWGDTKAGGPLRITITPRPNVQRFQFSKSELKKAYESRQPAEAIQGLFYLSYGMDERGKPRVYTQPGTTWRVRLVARTAKYTDERRKVAVEISAKVVLDEAVAALWLLCRFGGVGAKNRKGFGSMSWAESVQLTQHDVEASAAELRKHVLVEGTFSPSLAHSLSLEELETFDVPTQLTDYWIVLGQLGAAVQGFARQKGNKHNVRKRALGLPRQIHGPRKTDTPPPEALSITIGSKRITRHASPVFCHVDASDGGELTIRVSTFTARHLPNETESKAVLKDFRDFVEPALRSSATQHPPKGTKPGGWTPPVARNAAVPALESGRMCRAAFSRNERKRRVGWQSTSSPGYKATSSTQRTCRRTRIRAMSFRSLSHPSPPMGRHSPFGGRSSAQSGGHMLTAEPR